MARMLWEASGKQTIRWYEAGHFTAAFYLPEALEHILAHFKERDASAADASLEKQALAYFDATPEKQAAWRFDEKLDARLAADEANVRKTVWKAYQQSKAHEPLKKDYDAKEVRWKDHLSAYTLKKVGTRPKNGWPLFIAMHGGGGVPKAVNDRQWKIMQVYYRDQPEVTGYLYVALRAPNDVWNGFYAEYVPPLVMNLIKSFVLFGDVDTNKVFLMGYSHGGYGAFYIGPRIPDRCAAVHASAAAPSDSHTIAANLRYTPFTFMIGEKDTAYGRVDRCKAFHGVVEKLQQANKGHFPVQMEFIKGNAHTGLPDRDKIKEMYKHERKPTPKHLSWELSDSVLDRFYWLGVAKPSAGQSIEAKIEDNTVTLTTRNVDQVILSLDGRLVRFEKPLRIVQAGKTNEVTIRPSLLTLCESLRERGDAKLAGTCRVVVRVEK
jgi:predicted esterase